jgi:stress-induced morphogen
MDVAPAMIFRSLFPLARARMSSASSVTSDSLKKGLAALQPTHVDIADTSGGCGQSFNVLIVSDAFEGKSLLQRHR